MRNIIIIIIFLILCSFIGIYLCHAQTVTQLDSDNYYVQYEDGTNETVSLRSMTINVNGCLAEVNKYSNVLSIINGDQSGLIGQTQIDQAIQSVKNNKMGIVTP